MINDLFVRKASLKRVVDADTIDIMIDMGFRRYSVERIRLARINAPEVRGSEKELGLASSKFVNEVLPIDCEIVIQSSHPDAFGRWIAEVYYFDKEGRQVNLNDQLVELGLAKER